jgi:acetyl-CoA carboxylase carboxyl transferase subunit beta
LTTPRTTPATDLPPDWTHCSGCGTLQYAKKLARTLGVCPDCGHHQRLSAAERIEQLTDPGTFVPLGVTAVATDALGFTDSQPYPARLAKARTATGLDDAVVAGTARLSGRPLALAVMDFRFMGGSLGTAVGEMITTAAETALDQGVPLLIVTASGGARMQEGVLALLQMAKVSQAIAALREAGLLTISLVTDPTYGGVAASFATSCDIIVMEERARMGFAGPRVIQQTIRQELPGDFQTAAYLLAHGQVDSVQHRSELRPWLSRLLAATDASAAPAPTPLRSFPRSSVVTDPAQLAAVDPWTAVTTARDTGRPTVLDYLAGAFAGFVELHGDRMSADCPSIVAGFARLHGQPVAVVGHQKGHHTKELVARNFGMPLPEGYRKALRVMKMAEKFGRPVLTFIDTAGAYPGIDAEERGQAEAIARNLIEMAVLEVPIVATITGEGGSGGALALGVGDRVYVLEYATYSVISPEGCAAILWKDQDRKNEAAEAMKITAPDLLALGVVDEIIPEPPGGAHTDPEAACRRVGDVLERALNDLQRLPTKELIARRYEKFRALGAFDEG